MKFDRLAPEQVVVGGGRNAPDAGQRLVDLAPFIEAVKTMEAGSIILDERDTKEKVTKLLRMASDATKVKTRSRWVTDKMLVWKRVGPNAHAA